MASCIILRRTSVEELIGEVVRLTFFDEESSFTVAKLLPHEQIKEVTIVGNLPCMQVGHIIRCMGTWTTHQQHGKQFNVEQFFFELPTHPSAIIKMLSSGYIKGIGPSLAKTIVSAFGEKTFHIFDKEPSRLALLKGVGEKRAASILRQWKERTHFQELLALLSTWNISASLATRIFKTFGVHSVQTITTQPYKLAQEVDGIGFHIADTIASKLGIAHDSPERIDAAIIFFLWEFAIQGNTCVPFAHFIATVSEKLTVEASLLTQRLSSCYADKSITLTLHNNEPIFVALNQLFYSEQHIVAHIKRLQASPSALRSVDIEKAIAWSEEQTSVHFALKQKHAIALTLQEKVSIITGGPGTGKSTITNAIVKILSKLTNRIVIIAPTGKAAKRLFEVTGRYSQTIHRLLKFQPLSGSFFHNHTNRINCDLVIVDEVSMMDTLLTKALLESLPDTTKLVLIGDKDQLPSIGAGNVLKDLIESKLIPTVHLDEIFRQARHSAIIRTAHSINKGFLPSFETTAGSDFVFVEHTDPKMIRQTIVQLVTTTIPHQYGYDAKKEIQVISPMRKGECGIDLINQELQTAFATSSLRIGKFLLGDKVIQTKNNYNKEVFNGDIGYIIEIDQEEDIATIAFEDRVLHFTSDELDDVALAWAVSVHKYQGSESPCVIIPIHTQHFKLLNRNLLYTAVTRGKKLVILIGSKKAVAIAVRQENTENRWTQLKDLCSRL